MSDSIFHKDDTVFLADGTECIYVAAVPSTQKHIVDEVSTFGLDNDLVFNTIIVDEVYPEPPIRKRHEEVTRLDNLLREKREQIRQLEAAHLNLQGDIKDSKAIMAKHNALLHLDDFLERRFGFVVSFQDWHGIEVKTFDEAFSTGDRYDKGIRLLTLFGRSGGDLQWKLNSYSDASGNYWDVYPCRNLSEVHETILTILDRQEKEFAAREFSVDRLNRLEASIGVINKRFDSQVTLPKSLEAARDKKEELELTARREQLMRSIQEIDKKLAR